MIRTHLITGFLGVGKTTAILHLLQHKPAHEKWAVLVNEFGEVGVDGAILAAQGAVVKEVPGGCLCCVSGLPFQMGLNMLIAREQPDVLLIEPTGLGHPRNILNTLRNEHYRDILSIGAALCILDPRHLLNPRYTDNDVYADQIQLADVLVANKTDLCGDAERAAFGQLLADAQPRKSGSAWVVQGQLSPELLLLPADPQRLALHPDAHAHNRKESLPLVLPLAAGETFRRLQNQGQGYYSLGWLLRGDQIFSARALRNWLGSVDIERAKGIVATDEGPLVLNMRDAVLSDMPTRPPEEGRIELIDAQPLAVELLEQAMLACRLEE